MQKEGIWWQGLYVPTSYSHFLKFGPTQGEFPRRPLFHQSLDSSGSEVGSHVAKHKLSPDHIPMVCQNAEGHGHGLLDFHVSIGRIFDLQWPVNEGSGPVEENQCWCRTPSLVTGRRLVSGPMLEKLGVSSQHIRTLPHHISLYIWTVLSLFALEIGGRAAYMKLALTNLFLPITKDGVVQKHSFC